MNDAVARLTTPEECETFVRLMSESYPQLAKEAAYRGIQLRAAKHVVKHAVEREILEAIYAYEDVLAKKNGRKTRASRTWGMVERHGACGAAERAVNREDDPKGYETLASMGLEHLTFEAILDRYPSLFNPKAVARARERLTERKRLL